MSHSNPFTFPIIIIVGGIISIVVAILVLPMIGSTGVADAQTVQNLGSGSAELSGFIGGFALILGLGVLGRLFGK